MMTIVRNDYTILEWIIFDIRLTNLFIIDIKN